MPPSLEAAAVTQAYRDRLGTIRDAATRVVARPWTDIDLDADLAGAFDGWLADAVEIVTSAQITAAQLSDAYISQYLRTVDLEPVDADIDLARTVGQDFDGHPLDRSLDSSRIATLWMLGRRRGRRRALAYGLDTAIRTSRSAVMATARDAGAQRMSTEPTISGWQRVALAGSCGACFALAGRRSATSDPFDAHDRCRCTAEPLLRDIPEDVPRPTGQQRFDQMTPEQRLDRFGEAKTTAVEREGVDALIARLGGRIKEATPGQVT